MATTVTRTRHNVSLYVHFLPYLFSRGKPRLAVELWLRRGPMSIPRVTDGHNSALASDN